MRQARFSYTILTRDPASNTPPSSLRGWLLLMSLNGISLDKPSLTTWLNWFPPQLGAIPLPPFIFCIALTTASWLCSLFYCLSHPVSLSARKTGTLCWIARLGNSGFSRCLLTWRVNGCADHHDGQTHLYRLTLISTPSQFHRHNAPPLPESIPRHPSVYSHPALRALRGINTSTSMTHTHTCMHTHPPLQVHPCEPCCHHTATTQIQPLCSPALSQATGRHTLTNRLGFGFY